MKEEKKKERKRAMGVNKIKFIYMHVWRCHEETPYYVQSKIQNS
jgi:hypothetical protein